MERRCRTSPAKLAATNLSHAAAEWRGQVAALDGGRQLGAVLPTRRRGVVPGARRRHDVGVDRQEAPRGQNRPTAETLRLGRRVAAVLRPRSRWQERHRLRAGRQNTSVTSLSIVQNWQAGVWETMNSPVTGTNTPPPAIWRWAVLIAISVAMFGNYYVYDSIGAGRRLAATRCSASATRRSARSTPSTASRTS